MEGELEGQVGPRTFCVEGPGGLSGAGSGQLTALPARAGGWARGGRVGTSGGPVRSCVCPGGCRRAWTKGEGCRQGSGGGGCPHCPHSDATAASGGGPQTKFINVLEKLAGHTEGGRIGDHGLLQGKGAD